VSFPQRGLNLVCVARPAWVELLSSFLSCSAPHRKSHLTHQQRYLRNLSTKADTLSFDNTPNVSQSSAIPPPRSQHEHPPRGYAQSTCSSYLRACMNYSALETPRMYVELNICLRPTELTSASVARSSYAHPVFVHHPSFGQQPDDM
jgi:hypothetical protein